jgi:hypothetical protein
MLPLHDTHIRTALLNYISVQLGDGDPGELRAAGLEIEQLGCLRELSAFNLKRLAAMRQVQISVCFESDGLKAGLRSLGLTGETKALETYFLCNGASWRLMRSLFKMGRKSTYKRRRQWDAWQQPGNVRLPSLRTRQRIYRAWTERPDKNLRTRYYRLHQAFPQYTIAALENVVRKLELKS